VSEPSIDDPLPTWADPMKRPLLPDDPLPDWAQPKPSRLVATPAEADRVLVIDVSNLAWRSAFAHASLKAPDGASSGGVYGALSELLSKLNRLPAGKWCVAFCYDGPGATAARREVLPCYKTRVPHEIENPVPGVTAALSSITGLHLRADRTEADDLAAWMSTSCETPVVLISNDRDFWGLVRDGVDVLSPTLGRYVKPADVEKEFGIGRYDQIYLAKSLFGDSSDTIPGIPRLIKKKLRPYFDTGVLEPQAFYDTLAANDWKGISAGARKKIIGGRAQVETNYRVVVPWLDAIAPDAIHVVEGDMDGIDATMKRYGIRELVSRAGVLTGSEWISDGRSFERESP
jgi:hypothetical protein